jgi:hypothetical protein
MGPQISGDYSSSSPRRGHQFLTHSNSEEGPLFCRGHILFHWRQYFALRCNPATQQRTESAHGSKVVVPNATNTSRWRCNGDDT